MTDFKPTKIFIVFKKETEQEVNTEDNTQNVRWSGTRQPSQILQEHQACILSEIHQ